MPSNIEFLASEAEEVHEYLDRRGIPRTQVDISGKLLDANRMPCYIMPLIDRVIMWKDLG